MYKFTKEKNIMELSIQVLPHFAVVFLKGTYLSM